MPLALLLSLSMRVIPDEPSITQIATCLIGLPNLLFDLRERRDALFEHFFVPLSLEVDESLDRRTPELYRYKELHNRIQLVWRGLRSAAEVALALYRPR